MNSNKYLLDTCFIIRWNDEQPDALQMIAQHNLRPEQCYYSDVSYVELFSWKNISPQIEQDLKYLLDGIPRLPIDNQVLDTTIWLRRQFSIKLPDALILATAKVHKLNLLTLDDKLQTIFAKVYQEPT